MTSSTCWSTSSISRRITLLSRSISADPSFGFWMKSDRMSTAVWRERGVAGGRGSGDRWGERWVEGRAGEGRER